MAATVDYENKLEEWNKKAKKAWKLIISTITASVMTYIEGERNPAEMWRILEGINQKLELLYVSYKGSSIPSRC